MPSPEPSSDQSSEPSSEPSSVQPQETSPKAQSATNTTETLKIQDKIKSLFIGKDLEKELKIINMIIDNSEKIQTNIDNFFNELKDVDNSSSSTSISINSSANSITNTV